MGKPFMGEQLQVFFGSGNTLEVIAASTSCSININADTIDVSTKDSGRFGSSLAGKVTWDISADALFMVSDSGDTRYSYEKLLDSLISGEPLDVSWATVSNFDTANAASDNNSDEYGNVFTPSRKQTSAKDLYSGKAVVTSLQLTADNGSLSTYSVTFAGKGKITKTTASGE